MHFVAIKMLTGDRAKYLGLIFTIAFASFLLANQVSIFAGIIKRTASQINGVVDADIWVMDPATEYFDEVKPSKTTDLLRVRGVPGVEWGVRLFKGLPRMTAPDGRFRAVILMGLDDDSLVGAPHGKMRLGNLQSLREPDSIVLDYAGYRYFWPNDPLELDRTMEMNDHRVRIVGISDASAPFTTFPVVFARYSQAIQYVGPERNLLSFVLVKAKPGVDPSALATSISKATGLSAMTNEAFAWRQ
ncbi:MAG: ABC transporter permease [Gammaproteobacteria bacterium]